MKLVGTRAISCVVLRGLAKGLGFTRGLGGEVAVALLLSASLAFLGWIVNRLAGAQLTRAELVGLATTSLLLGGSFLVVKVLHDAILPPNAPRVMDLLQDADSLITVRDWFRLAFRLQKQLLTSILVAGAGLLTVEVMSQAPTNLHSAPGLLVTVFGGMFGLGHGVYCALVIPTLARRLSAHRLRLYPYDPASSAGLIATSSSFGRLSVANGAVSTYLIALILLSGAWAADSGQWIALGWMVSGWGLATYSFLFPNFHISRVIKAARLETLAKLELLAIDPHEKGGQKQWPETLSEIVELRRQVQQTRSTSIDFRGVRDYVSSLVLPLLTFLLGLYQGELLS